MKVRYLLGELAEEERIQFEEACFGDDLCFEELLAVEAELTDDYVHGQLVGRRREHFEKLLLQTAEGRDDLEFARLMTDAPAPKADVIERRSNWRNQFAWLDVRGWTFQVSLAALTLILMGLGLWSFWSFRQARLQREQAARQSSPPVTPAEEPGQAPLPSQSPGSTPEPYQASASPEPPHQRDNGKTPIVRQAPAIVTLLLVPGFDRAVGGANDLVLPAQGRTVNLQFALEGDSYRSYQAVMRSVEGKEIFRRGGLRARSTTSRRGLTLAVPAAAFPEGDFILTLSGITSQGKLEDVHKYFLNVRKKR